MSETKSDQGEAKGHGNDSEVLEAVTRMLDVRGKQMGEATRKNFGAVLADGRYLDEGTPEQASWHAGYVSAMQDTLRLIERRPHEWPLEIEGVGTPEEAAIS